MALPYVTERQIADLLKSLENRESECDCLNHLISDTIYFDGDVYDRDFYPLPYDSSFILPFELDTSMSQYDGILTAEENVIEENYIKTQYNDDDGKKTAMTTRYMYPGKYTALQPYEVYRQSSDMVEVLVNRTVHYDSSTEESFYSYQLDTTQQSIEDFMQSLKLQIAGKTIKKSIQSSDVSWEYYDEENNLDYYVYPQINNPERGAVFSDDIVTIDFYLAIYPHYAPKVVTNDNIIMDVTMKLGKVAITPVTLLVILDENAILDILFAGNNPTATSDKGMSVEFSDKYLFHVLIRTQDVKPSFEEAVEVVLKKNNYGVNPWGDIIYTPVIDTTARYDYNSSSFSFAGNLKSTVDRYYAVITVDGRSICTTAVKEGDYPEWHSKYFGMEAVQVIDPDHHGAVLYDATPAVYGDYSNRIKLFDSDIISSDEETAARIIDALQISINGQPAIRDYDAYHYGWQCQIDNDTICYIMATYTNYGDPYSFYAYCYSESGGEIPEPIPVAIYIAEGVYIESVYLYPYEEMYNEFNLEDGTLAQISLSEVYIPDATYDKAVEVIQAANNTLFINSQGYIDVAEYAEVYNTGINPQGTLRITNNGYQNVRTYEGVDVQVPASAVVSGTKNINTNGTHDVVQFADVSVNVPASAVVSGTRQVTQNGLVDITEYQYANIEVPASAVVSGTIEINNNGTIDVTAYKDASVNVPASAVVSGEKVISENGVSDVTTYASVNVSVPASAVVSGVLDITSNGVHNVTDFAQASVNVPASAVVSGTRSITENGTVDVTNYANAAVNVPASAVVSGTKQITQNGLADITEYASVNVNVPASEVVSGTKDIVTNGITDITTYQKVNVNVPASAVVSGTKTIEENGLVDVTTYENAQVSVPASAVVSGTMNVATNGIHDITQYANVNVQVPASEVVSGTVSYATNGTFDVTAYKDVEIAVPASAVVSGTVTVSTNGLLDVTDYKDVDVQIPLPTGVVVIKTNGIENVAQYATAQVNVPASAVVSGTVTYTTNGTFDVTDYKDVQIGVPASAVVSGTASYTTNGTFDITNYKDVDINVPASAVVSGTVSYTANGTFDVTTYKDVQISVPASAVVSGTKNINTNGTTDVTTYAAVSVSVPASAVVSGTVSYATNGTFDVTSYKDVQISVPASAVVSGTYTVTETGTYDITNYATVSVDIPSADSVAY